MMKFNNAYLPLFFFCWALLYSPLAVWYAFEQSEKLPAVDAKVRYNLNKHMATDIDCLSCRYALLRFTMRHNTKECPVGDQNPPFFVFYKSN